jgi:hypothetical protein
MVLMSRTGKLHLGAGETGAGASGDTTCAAERAIIGLVAGNVQFKERASGNVEFEPATAAVNDSSGGDGEAAFLFDDADRLACGTASGPHVFDYQNAFAGLQFESAAQCHLAGAVAFNEQRADIQRTSDFVADNDAAECGRNDAGYAVIFEALSEGVSELFGALGMLEDKSTLDVGAAVASAGKFEVAGANGAHLFEELENFVALHGSLSGPLAQREC